MNNHKNRAMRKHAERLKKDHARKEKKHRLERVLSDLGLLRGYKELPGWVRDLFVTNLPIRPIVVISPTAHNTPEIETIKRRIERVFEQDTVLAENGRSFPLADFFSICLFLRGNFMSVASAPLSREQKKFVLKAGNRVSKFLEDNFDFQISLLSTTIVTELATYSRVDGTVYGCILDVVKSTPAESTARFTLITSEPREIRVAIDGKVRPAFQFAIPLELKGINWAEADGGAFGLVSSQMYPIYIQSHAIRRLRERLSTTFFPEFTIQLGLMNSITDLAVIERQGDRCLIEFKLCGIRIGYLASRVVDGKIVIVTFLFLTMEGTPENRLLKRRHGVTSRDISYMGLDRFETFLSPDVIVDRQLTGVLNECGCGELLYLERLRSPQAAENERAEEIRRYLGLTGVTARSNFIG
jgi:hypothetical protein